MGPPFAATLERRRTSGRDVRRLPKAHLHLHLVGAMRRGTLEDLSRMAGMPVPETRSDLQGWGRFDAAYRAAQSLIRTEGDLFRLVREIAEDEVGQGSRWTEITTNPGLYQGRFGTEEDVLELLLDAGRAAGDQTGLGIGWVVSAGRNESIDAAVSLAKLAVRYAGSGVVGFGLANDERIGETADWAPAFDIARDGGLLSVPHAGELVGPQSVRQAVDQLGANRVGHATSAIRDRRLIARMADRDVCVEVCLSANHGLGVIEALHHHPLPDLLDEGLDLALAADNPMLFGAGVADEFETARTVFGLSDKVLAELAVASVVHSAAPAGTKSRLMRDIAGWLAADLVTAAA